MNESKYFRKATLIYLLKTNSLRNVYGVTIKCGKHPGKLFVDILSPFLINAWRVTEELVKN